MTEQFRDCSSSSLKGGKKARGDLSRSYLLLCFSFLSKPLRLMSYHHLFPVSVMAFCSYPACVLSFPTQNSFICCWGREFPFVIPFSSLFCVHCLSEGAQILGGVPRPCHCLTASSRTEASLVSLPEVLQSVLKEQLYFH